MKKVSIVLPAYNAENNISKCLDSIIRQSFKDWELLIVNDGSSDKTGEICKAYSLTDERIHYYEISNKGVSFARNYGISNSSGEYITFIDSDDSYEYTFLHELLIKRTEFHDKLPVCNYYRVNGIGEKQANSVDLIEQIYPRSKTMKLFRFELIGIVWNKLYRSDVIKRNSIQFPESCSLGEDLLFNISYLTVGNEDFFYIDRCLYNYSIDCIDSLSKRIPFNPINSYDNLYSSLKEYLLFCDRIKANWEREFALSYFYALDSCIRNKISLLCKSESDKNYSTIRSIFRSDGYQYSKTKVQGRDINKIQLYALNTNNYVIYIITIVVTEFISRTFRRVKRIYVNYII